MTDLYLCLRLSMEKGLLQKVILSKPLPGFPKRIDGRLSYLRGEAALTTETPLAGGKVLHKHYPLSGLTEAAFQELTGAYRQINLFTAVGNCEYKKSNGGSEVCIGGGALFRQLAQAGSKGFTDITVDRQKNYLLNGSEDFLKKLEISDKNGRIHDKKQAKFRQINRFLEHVAEIYPALPPEGTLLIYDLCCGKSYLSFAVYYYLTVLKNRTVEMLGMDLKTDVIAYCSEVASALGYTGMTFCAGDIRKTPKDRRPHLVISLHACDIATDIVLQTAVSLQADVILSTPCCHHYLESRIQAPELSFVTDQPFLRHKLAETLTDGLRVLQLTAAGYKVTALELTDPENTPKNTLIRAVRQKDAGDAAASERYQKALHFLLGDAAESYLAEVQKP